MNTTAFPKLEGDARQAAAYRGGHLQIIASAGSGKTEVVAQRVASLLHEGVDPTAIVAFTFTERAAASLKSRIEKRVAALQGEAFLDRLNGMFVGTIHSYCFRILQQHVPEYETYDVLDDHRLTAFLTREAYDLRIVPKIDSRLFAAIKLFGKNVQVVENELIEPRRLDDPFREVYEAYVTALKEHRFLTYGQIIARAVQELRDPATFRLVHEPLSHLIVDEYQDINPAQEELIKRLSQAPVHLCVVGDDDQSIYQWRGSQVENIVEFDKRYAPVKRFQVEVNRRSRPGIIDTANDFAPSIDGRLSKSMRTHREASGPEVVSWMADTDADEAATIAKAIKRAHDKLGYHYREIAILCRGRVSFPAIMEALRLEDIPVQPGGRTHLFSQEDADLFGRTMCWLAGFNWRVGQYNWTDEPVTLADLVVRYSARFGLMPAAKRKVKAHLEGWKARVPDTSQPANLVRDLYDLLGTCGVEDWDLTDVRLVNRLGTLARCSQVLVDYESTRRRATPTHIHPGEMGWNHDRGLKYYQWLARYIQNWARGAYEDFEGEEDVDLDAVDLTTVHQAKGLEWPIVFVPALKNGRFPSTRRGNPAEWLVPMRLFDADRYDGSENDERRLFYVAMTRARDFLSLSTFCRMKNKAKPSPFLLEVAGGEPKMMTKVPDPPPPDRSDEEREILEITFSDLAAFLECGLSYRLRRLIGFQPPLAPEIGYGKAVHHVLRRVADHVQKYGKKPTPKQVERIFDDEFYLPAANPSGYRRMKDRAKVLVDRYLTDWSSDLERIWEVERPFELHLGHATISGRADVILDEANGGPQSLTIVDYKTAADGHASHDFQLQVYTDAGRREGLIVDNAFVHSLGEETDRARVAVPVSGPDIVSAESKVQTLVADLREKRYVPRPQSDLCGRCDVRSLCRHRA